MTTITTVQLRNNLKDVVARLDRGETIRLKYRQRVLGSIVPVQSIKKPAKPKKGSGEAILNFIANRSDIVASKVKNDPRPIKEIYEEMRMNDFRRR